MIRTMAILFLAAASLFGQCFAAKVGHERVKRRVYTLPDTLSVQGERIGIDPFKVPVAATLRFSSAWSTARLGGIDEALQDIPGVTAQSRAGGQDARITIRGFGARGAGERSNAGTTRGIRISLDGFPLTEPDGRTSLDFADLGLMEAVRVVRSNTSGLYGPASGGLIDLYSTSKFATPFVETRAQFGSYGFARQQAEAGILSGSTRLRLAVSTSNFDGWRGHSGGAQTTVLASVQADPSPRTSLGVYLAGTRNLQRQAGALTQAEFDGDPRQADPTYVAQNARRDNRIGRAGVRLQQGVGGTGVLQLAAFLEPKTIHRSERGRYRDFQRIHTGGSGLYTIPLSVGSSMLRWTTGFDDAYQDGSVLFYTLGPDGTRGTSPSDLIANKREGINTLGAFTEVSVVPAPRWDITAGVRWGLVHFIFEDYQDPTLDDSRDLKRASPRATLSYRVRPTHSLYTALSSGIETPAFNEIDPPAPWDAVTGLNPFLKPAYSRTMEIGAKGKFRFGWGLDTASYDVAFYTLDVNNEIIPWNGGAYYTTAGKSRRSGIEFGLSAATDNGLSGRATLTASRNRYVDYVTGIPAPGGGLLTVDYGGNDAAGIPGIVFDAGLRYAFWKGPYVEAGYRRVNAYPANDAGTDLVPAYGLIDATVGASRRFGVTELGMFISGRNLTNEKYAASAYVNGVGGRYLEPGMERNILVGMSLRFAGEGAHGR
jgi:iron complex outermembrane recepter protein